jgi:hypothetical protein
LDFVALAGWLELRPLQSAFIPTMIARVFKLQAVKINKRRWFGPGACDFPGLETALLEPMSIEDTTGVVSAHDCLSSYTQVLRFPLFSTGDLHWRSLSKDCTVPCMGVQCSCACCYTDMRMRGCSNIVCAVYSHADAPFSCRCAVYSHAVYSHAVYSHCRCSGTQASAEWKTHQALKTVDWVKHVTSFSRAHIAIFGVFGGFCFQRVGKPN